MFHFGYRVGYFVIDYCLSKLSRTFNIQSISLDFLLLPRPGVHEGYYISVETEEKKYV